MVAFDLKFVWLYTYRRNIVMDLPHWRLHKLDTTGRAFKPSSDKPEEETAIEGQRETGTEPEER